jgi:hypothetical protein
MSSTHSEYIRPDGWSPSDEICTGFIGPVADCVVEHVDLPGNLGARRGGGERGHPQSGIEMSSTRQASPSANPIAVLVSEANPASNSVNAPPRNWLFTPISSVTTSNGPSRSATTIAAVRSESVPAGGSDHFRFGGRPALNSQFPHELGRPVFELSYPFTNGLRITEGQYPNQCQGG